MSNKSSCNPVELLAGIRSHLTPWFSATVVFCALVAPSAARGGDAPAWMHALVGVPLPATDEKTEAVLLYSETMLNVQANGKIKSIERRAYKILRPGGKEYGTVRADFDAETRITSIHGWCIPTQGKDY